MADSSAVSTSKSPSTFRLLEAPLTTDSQGQQITLTCGFAKITADCFRGSTWELGKDLAIRHIRDVKEVQQEDNIYITCKCKRSTNLNEKPYSVELKIDPVNRKVLDGHCSCQAGIDGLCKHGSGLVHFINSEREESCTSGEQQWGKLSKKSKDLFPKGETVLELEGKSSGSKQLSSFLPDKDALSSWSTSMEQFGMMHCGAYKLINSKYSEEQPKQQESWKGKFTSGELAQLQSMFESPEEIFFVTSLPDLPMNEASLISKLKLTKMEAFELFGRTMGQSETPEWHQQRKQRITGSKAHKIAHGRSTETRWRHFQDSTVNVFSIQYGRQTEGRAREVYCQVTGNKVVQSGLIVKSGQEWLAASPDGIILGESLSLLEIKCPSSCRDADINVDYIKDGKLSKKHAYYTQIQVQLYVANVKSCDFFVYSDKDYVLLTVPRDDDFL